MTGSGGISPAIPDGASSVTQTLAGTFVGLIVVVVIAAIFATAEPVRPVWTVSGWPRSGSTSRRGRGRGQRRQPQTPLHRIRPEVPDGWLSLDDAATALGMSRQTVLHQVQRGELNAAHVNRGRRRGLRIQVKHDQPGLFDTPH